MFIYKQMHRVEYPISWGFVDRAGHVCSVRNIPSGVHSFLFETDFFFLHRR